MKSFEEADEIRRAYMQIGTIAGAARACGCTWRTAKAAILRDYSRNGGRSPRRQRPSPWRARIEALLDANADDERESRKLRLTAARIGALLRREGCRLCARHVRRLCASVRAERAERRRDAPKLRLGALPGDYQADFGEMACAIGGRRVRAHVLVLASRYSGAFEAIAVPTEKQEHLFAGLEACFRRLGGVPPRIRFDNAPGIAVFAGGKRRMADAFGRFACHMGFEAQLCAPRAGWEKGAAEQRVGYIRRNFFVPVPAFPSLEALNRSLALFCLEDRRRDCPSGGRAIADALESERIALLPMAPPFAFARCVYTRADRQGMIIADGVRYFCGAQSARARVCAEISAQEVRIYRLPAMQELAVHPRRYGGGVSMGAQAVAGMLAEKPGAIARAFPGAPGAQELADAVRAMRPAERAGAILDWIEGLGRA